MIMSKVDVAVLILEALCLIAMIVIIFVQERNKSKWKDHDEILEKHEKYLFKLESGIIISGYATTVTSEYYQNNPQWVFDQEKSGIHFEDTCGYRIFKWMELN